jgi:hypothetical protein
MAGFTEIPGWAPESAKTTYAEDSTAGLSSRRAWRPPRSQSVDPELKHGMLCSFCVKS